MRTDILLNKPMDLRKNSKLTRKRKTAKTQRFSAQKTIFDHVGKYDVLKALATAESEVSFGQLARGDGDEAETDIRRLLTTKQSRQLKFAAAAGTKEQKHSKALKRVQFSICGSTSEALLDSGATPNLLSKRLAE